MHYTQSFSVALNTARFKTTRAKLNFFFHDFCIAFIQSRIRPYWSWNDDDAKKKTEGIKQFWRPAVNIFTYPFIHPTHLFILLVRTNEINFKSLHHWAFMIFHNVFFPMRDAHNGWWHSRLNIQQQRTHIWHIILNLTRRNGSFIAASSCIMSYIERLVRIFDGPQWSFYMLPDSPTKVEHIVWLKCLGFPASGGLRIAQKFPSSASLFWDKNNGNLRIAKYIKLMYPSYIKNVFFLTIIQLHA